MAVSNHIRQLVPTLFVVMALAVLAVQPAAHSDERESIVIVVSRDDGPYEGIVSGVRRLLASRAGDLKVTIHSLQADAEKATEALRLARREGGTPIITVGSAASRAVLQAEGKAPVIACMTADEQGLLESENATGVLLEFPVETHFRWMRRLVPKSQSIGVLYNRDENHERIEDAKKIARKLGLRLITREIGKPQDLPHHLPRVLPQLWKVYGPPVTWLRLATRHDHVHARYMIRKFIFHMLLDIFR